MPAPQEFHDSTLYFIRAENAVTTDNGQLTTDNGQLTTDNGQLTTDN
ncbi:MAG: hypothetical protein ACK513_18525 [Aphanizomenon sp.]